MNVWRIVGRNMGVEGTSENCRERWLTVNASHPSLWIITSSDNTLLSMMAMFYDAGDEVEIFAPHSTIQSWGTHLPGRDRHRIDLITRYKSIWFYFNLCIMKSISGWRIRVMGDYQRLSLVETKYNSPHISEWISNIINISHGRQNLVVEI